MWRIHEIDNVLTGRESEWMNGKEMRAWIVMEGEKS